MGFFMSLMCVLSPLYGHCRLVSPLGVNTNATFSNNHHVAANIHTIVYNIRRDTSNADTTAPDVRHGVSKTRVIVSEVRNGATNTRTVASDVHRNTLRSREDTDGRNQAVSASCIQPTTE